MKIQAFAIGLALLCQSPVHLVLARDVEAYQPSPVPFYRRGFPIPKGPEVPPEIPVPPPRVEPPPAHVGGVGDPGTGSNPGYIGGLWEPNPISVPDNPFLTGEGIRGVYPDGTPEQGTLSSADEELFDLGTYSGASQEALFMNFDGANGPYFSKVADFFASKDPTFYSDNNPYTAATGNQQPFPNGRPTGQTLAFSRTITSPATSTFTSLFDPQAPTAICGAWSSLAAYCASASTDCACYSNTYYVPEQWNSLAAGCAALTTVCSDPSSSGWCELAWTAAASTTYCPAYNANGSPGVRFAAQWTSTSAYITPAPTGAAAVSTSPSTGRASSGPEPWLSLWTALMASLLCLVIAL